MEGKEFVDELTLNILPFWMSRMADPSGGFYGRISGEGLLDKCAPKGTILNARILWTFSAAYNALGKKEYLDHAQRAYLQIKSHFLDKEYGGLYWILTHDNIPLDTKKQFYAIAFGVYGLSEYYNASGDKEALELAISLFKSIEEHSRDRKSGGYIEATTRDWGPLSDLRLSIKDQNDAKTMNTHLHILEGYTNLYKYWKDPALEEALKSLIDIFLDKIILSDGHMGLFYSKEWELHSNTISYGHDIEASWLLDEASKTIGHRCSEVEAACSKMAYAAADGLDTDGAMSYEYIPDKSELDTERHWWVQAETVVGFLYQSKRADPSFFEKAERNWSYIKSHLRDKSGEWLWSRYKNGAPNLQEDLAGFWKCPYHNSRMCLEAIELLKNNTPKLTKNNIPDIVKALSVDEKALLLTGVALDSCHETLQNSLGFHKERVPGAAGATHAIPRLGIPSIVLADGPAGVRINKPRTHFPIGSLLSSTWDTELVRQVGAAIGEEAAECGVDILLAPALNIHRHPLCGRNFEYYSEDPILSGKIASAYIKGVQSIGVGATVKHFAANNQETNRTEIDVRVSKEALDNIYLKGFEIAVKEASPWALMSSYNKINGVYSSQNRNLLEDKLRQEWGFDGVVMTDWYAGNDSVAQIESGNDMLQPGKPSQYREIINSVKSGKLSEQSIDKSVERVLSLIVKTRTFNQKSMAVSVNHSNLARKCGSEGMVLLKNDSETLPLKQSKLALFGNSSYNYIPGGTGSGNVTRAYTVSIATGLEDCGFVLDDEIKKLYERRTPEEKMINDDPVSKFLPDSLSPERYIEDDSIEKSANIDDYAIITIGRTSGEFCDRAKEDWFLSDIEQSLIEKVCSFFHSARKKVIIILNIGGVIETASWKELPDAILLGWQAGQEGGHAVADIVSGKVNPSGRLPMTWPISYKDHKSDMNFPSECRYAPKLDSFNGRHSQNNSIPIKDYDFVNYEEGCDIGYRWFNKAKIPISFPFGFGLSYTKFTVFRRNDKTIVKNIGSCRGKTVIFILNESKELLDFFKTKELAPEESEEFLIGQASEIIPAEGYAEVSFCIPDEKTYPYSVRVEGICSDGTPFSASGTLFKP